MSDQTPPNGHGDGAIDFSRYDLAQLRDLRALIDPTQRPLDHAHLLAEIDRREHLAPADAVAGPWPVRFTRPGPLGWLEALHQRMPVHGEGEVALEGEALVLHGWSRNWLAMAVPTVKRIPLASIRNVVVEDGTLRLDAGRLTQVRFKTASTAAAQAIAAALPDTRSAGFEQRWGAIRQFERALDAGGRHAWGTYGLIGLNLIAFAVQAWRVRRLTDFALVDLVALGGNYGPVTVSGEWWRLLTAAFLHLDWLHLAVNMWTLIGIGRLTERLYGSRRYLGLYLAMAVTASLSSLMWNPITVSLGASGAIFGIFGLFAAYLIRQRGQVPLRLITTHWLSTLAFGAFSLFSGFQDAGIDNAAHLGGLLTGLLLGLVVARPLGERGPVAWGWPRSGAVVAMLLVATGGAYTRLRQGELRLEPFERYQQTHAWYLQEATRNNETWQALVQLATGGTVSAAEVADRVEKEVLPFWQQAEDRVKKQDEGLAAEYQPISAALRSFIQARRAMIEGAVGFARGTLANDDHQAALLSAEEDATVRLQLLQFRATMSHRPAFLANRTIIAELRQWLFHSGERPCVTQPEILGQSASATDSRQDGPAQWQEQACQAQRRFLAEDYGQLEKWIDAYSATLHDLPDGSSRLDAVIGGISDLISYGGLTEIDAFGRIAAWQKAFPGSAPARLVETAALEDWAWAARGHGFANSVSGQALAIFRFRSKMADAVLDEIKSKAKDYPSWYRLAMDVGLDKGLDRTDIRRLFETGIAQHPSYTALHRAMLRTLMPRWHGTYPLVASFIEQQSNLAPVGQRYEYYARFYWAYRSLEDDDLDLAKEVRMDWPHVRQGMRGLMARYPQSDYWLNALASFACHVGDGETYRELRPQVEARPSSTAWIRQETREACDTKLASPSPAPETKATAP